MSLWHPSPLKHQHEWTIFLTFTKYSVTFSFGEAYKIGSSFCANHSLCIALFASMNTSMSPTSSTRVTLASIPIKTLNQMTNINKSQTKAAPSLGIPPKLRPRCAPLLGSVMEDKFCSIFKKSSKLGFRREIFMAVKCTRFTPVQWEKKNSVSVCRKGQ